MMDRNKEIFFRNISGESQTLLAKEYGISRSRVHEIVNKLKKVIKNAVNKPWYEKYQKVLSGINIEAELGSPWLTVSFIEWPGSELHIFDNSSNGYLEEIVVLAGFRQIALGLQVRRQ